MVDLEDLRNQMLLRGQFMIKFKESSKAISNRLIIKYDDLVYQLDKLFFFKMEGKKQVPQLSHQIDKDLAHRGIYFI